jgi:hypothetical protein
MQTLSEKEWYDIVHKKVAKLESLLLGLEDVTDETGWNAHKSISLSLQEWKSYYYDLDKGVNYTTLKDKYHNDELHKAIQGKTGNA